MPPSTTQGRLKTEDNAGGLRASGGCTLSLAQRMGAHDGDSLPLSEPERRFHESERAVESCMHTPPWRLLEEVSSLGDLARHIGVSQRTEQFL